MKRITKRLLIIGGAVGGTVVCLLALGIGLYVYVTKPLKNGAELGDRTVTTVVTGHLGPVAIAAYLFELSDGTMGLVDTGQDSEAVEIRKVLRRLSKKDLELRVILLTHAHDDHAGGIDAFPNAEVYAIEPDCDFIRKHRERPGVAAAMTKAVKDGDKLDLHGTHVEVYALPHARKRSVFGAWGVIFRGCRSGYARGDTRTEQSAFRGRRQE
jgi:hypothetical protein